MERLAIRDRWRNSSGVDPRTGAALGGTGDLEASDAEEGTDPGAGRARRLYAPARELQDIGASEEGNESPPPSDGPFFRGERRGPRSLVAIVGGIVMAACGAVGWAFASPGPSLPAGSQDTASNTAVHSRVPSVNDDGENRDGSEAMRSVYAAGERVALAALAGRGESEARPGGSDGNGRRGSERSHAAKSPPEKRLSGGEFSRDNGAFVAAAAASAERPDSPPEERRDEQRAGDPKRDEELGRGKTAESVESTDEERSGESKDSTSIESRAGGSARERDVPRRGRDGEVPRRLSDRQIRGEMRRISESVAACRQRHHRRGAPLDVQKIQMSIEVRPDGRVSSLEIEPSVEGTVFGNCLRNRVPQWSFPRFRGGPQRIENRSFVLQ